MEKCQAAGCPATGGGHPSGHGGEFVWIFFFPTLSRSRLATLPTNIGTFLFTVIADIFLVIHTYNKDCNFSSLSWFSINNNMLRHHLSFVGFFSCLLYFNISNTIYKFERVVPLLLLLSKTRQYSNRYNMHVKNFIANDQCFLDYWNYLSYFAHCVWII